jgi:iron complex outermembrane receptor protein
MVGYESQQLDVTESNATSISVSLAEQTIMGQEVIISASRVEESILESPVTVEKMGILAIKNTPSSDFYGGIADLKGVQMTTSSMMFKSVNTRGFATMANTRFVQLIDGMDNAAPGLNFPMGNIVGIGDLDIESVELVPGAASALYGPNAFNGILLMQSKSPFDYQGLSVTAKGGITTQDPYSTNSTNYPGYVDVKDEAAGTNGFYDFSARYAKAFNNKFAFKLNFSYLQAEDWHATDYSQHAKDDPGTYNTNVNGLNIYGDDIATTLDFDVLAGLPSGTGLFGRAKIARTGYKEVDLADYNTNSMKASVALHYRLTDKMELSYDYRYGNATSIYQGFSRYSLKNLTLQQHKLELKGDNFFIRAYGTFENAGDAYDTRFLAWNINRTWKDDPIWFQQYAGNYIGALAPIVGGGGVPTGAQREAAHNAARAAADIGRLVPGTDAYDAVKKDISELADLATGSKFIDKSKMYHAEGAYDFKNQISWLDLVVGANFRQYNLNSEGTIFNDAPDPEHGPISINEYGAYAQFSKRLINDALKLGLSVRYDKNENFDGQFSPRAFAVYSVDKNKKHNFRASFQTGFRNPDTQTQFIALDLGPATLVGGTQKNLDLYSKIISFDPANGDPVPAPVTYNILGSTLYDNAYTRSSAEAFAASGNPADLVIAENDLVKPEQITSYEFGYKGVFNNKLMLDLNYYHNSYTDFLQQNTVVVVPEEFDVNVPPPAPNSGVAALASASFGGPTLSYVYQLYSNSTTPVTSNGIGVGINYLLPRGYDLGGSYNYADFSFDEQSKDDIPGFNTPKHRYKIQFGNREAFNNFGFSLAYRWSDAYEWTGTFGNGPVPSFSSLDAQISYKLSGIRSIVKIGANNILGTEFVQAYGAPGIGSTFYASITFDELFNR